MAETLYIDKTEDSNLHTTITKQEIISVSKTICSPKYTGYPARTIIKELIL